MYYVFAEDICFVIWAWGLRGGRLDGVVRPFSGSSMEMDLSMESLTLSTTMDYWMEMVLLLDFNLEFVFVFSISGLGRRGTRCASILLSRRAPRGAVRPSFDCCLICRWKCSYVRFDWCLKDVVFPMEKILLWNWFLHAWKEDGEHDGDRCWYWLTSLSWRAPWGAVSPSIACSAFLAGATGRRKTIFCWFCPTGGRHGAL